MSFKLYLCFSDEENNSDSGSKNAPLREQDRFLPIANIAKIMKRAIPENGKVRCFSNKTPVFHCSLLSMYFQVLAHSMWLINGTPFLFMTM